MFFKRQSKRMIASRYGNSSLSVVHDREPNLLNTGLYTVPEAARLTRVSVGKIRRWLKGYNFRSGESVHHSDAVWQGEIKPMENKLALSFRDLLELRFVDAFIRAGVSWRNDAPSAREGAGAIEKRRIRFARIASSRMEEEFCCAKAKRIPIRLWSIS